LWILFLSCDVIFVLHVALMIFRLLLRSQSESLIGSGAPYCTSDLRSRARSFWISPAWIPSFSFLHSLPTESPGRAHAFLSWVFALVSVLAPRRFPHRLFFSADRDSVAFAFPWFRTTGCLVALSSIAGAQSWISISWSPCLVCACATIPISNFSPCFSSIARCLSAITPALDFFMRFFLSVLLCEYSGSISVIYSDASCSS
jgi:hypothetical protein